MLRFHSRVHVIHVQLDTESVKYNHFTCSLILEYCYFTFSKSKLWFQQIPTHIKVLQTHRHLSLHLWWYPNLWHPLYLVKRCGSSSKILLLLLVSWSSVLGPGLWALSWLLFKFNILYKVSSFSFISLSLELKVSFTFNLSVILNLGPNSANLAWANQWREEEIQQNLLFFLFWMYSLCIYELHYLLLV